MKDKQRGYDGFSLRLTHVILPTMAGGFVAPIAEALIIGDAPHWWSVLAGALVGLVLGQALNYRLERRLRF